jgi:hypothetical protein
MRHTFPCGVKLNGIREIRSISNMRRLSPPGSLVSWPRHPAAPAAPGPLACGAGTTPEREMTARTVQALASAG